MIKRKINSSLKYLGIAMANAMLLTGLLALWTDSLEMSFHELVRPIEFLKILGISCLVVGAMFLLTLFWRSRPVKLRTKIMVASLLTVVVSSGLYAAYGRRVIHNVIIEGQLRTSIADKIRPSHGLANGTQADHLSEKEYQELARTAGFPDLPLSAVDIRYDYQYDGFLPDYSLDITYMLPASIGIPSCRESHGVIHNTRLSKRQESIEGFPTMNTSIKIFFPPLDGEICFTGPKNLWSVSDREITSGTVPLCQIAYYGFLPPY